METTTDLRTGADAAAPDAAGGEAAAPRIRCYTGKGGIPSNALKLIAIALMLIDHTCVVFAAPLAGVITDSGVGGLRTLARVAFPLFAFFIAVGASYTKNIKKYLLRLLAFALVSEVPFDLAFFGTWLEFSYQNVFFTLLLGLLCIYVYQTLRPKLTVLAVLFVLVAAFSAEYLLCCDYGFTGVACIFLFYLFLHMDAPFRHIGIVFACFTVALVPGAVNIGDLAVPFFAVNKYELFAVAAAPLMLLYNGEKGFYMNRWFFYAFYPAHLLLLGLIHLAVAR